MKRVLAALVLSIGLVVSSVSSTFAVSALINPHTQSHGHGVASSWTLTWSGTHPFDVYFWWDTNDTSANWILLNTSTTSKKITHAFFPCTTTTFDQELDTYDQHGGAFDTSTAQETGGNPC